MTPYNREATAYAYLLHADVRSYIPKVYGTAKRTVSGWGLDHIDGDNEGEYYGILMEWIEGSEQLTEANITIDLAVCLVNGLARIHEAGVLHDDTYERNILVVPGTSRGVWIDFSCSQVELVDEYLNEEMYIGGAIPIEIVGVPFLSVADQQLCERMKRDARAEVSGQRVLASMTMRQRISCITYLAWFLAEGAFSFLHQFPIYFVGSGLLVAFLYSYVGGRFARYCFRVTTVVHQVSLTAISLWKLANHDMKASQIWPGFQAVILLYCATGEVSATVLEIGEVLSHVFVNEHAEIEMDWLHGVMGGA
jgi:serine/threonine protein kinase